MHYLNGSCIWYIYWCFLLKCYWSEPSITRTQCAHCISLLIHLYLLPQLLWLLWSYVIKFEIHLLWLMEYITQNPALIPLYFIEKIQWNIPLFMLLDQTRGGHLSYVCMHLDSIYTYILSSLLMLWFQFNFKSTRLITYHIVQKKTCLLLPHLHMEVGNVSQESYWNWVNHIVW